MSTTRKIHPCRWTTHVVGALSGTTNAGTHHPPLSNCKSYDVKGRMGGRLVGEITKGPLIRGRIFAMYVILYGRKSN